MLDYDNVIYKRMDPPAIEHTRAELLGKDSSGKWYYYLRGLERRVYTMASPWKPRPLPEVPHLVRVGERVEVEVEEKKGEIEWRQGEVRALLGGGKGRFSVCVDGKDGEPDEEFIEVFTAPLMGVEWRKLPPKEPKNGKGGGRKTRVTDAMPPPKSKTAAAAAREAAKITAASEDPKTFALLDCKVAAPKLRASKAKLDQAVAKALMAVLEERAEHDAASTSRCAGGTCPHVSARVRR